MKKTKLFKYPLITLVFLGFSTTSVSCLYENDPTVLYAKKFQKENAFTVKNRVAPKENKKLVNFENELFNSKKLEYNFNNFNYKPENRNFEINNDHLIVKIKNGYTLTKNEQIILNQAVVDAITDAKAKSNYQNLLTNLQNQISNYLNSKDHSVSIKDIKNKNFDEGSVNNQILELNKTFNLIDQFFYYDLTDSSQIINKEDVFKIVENYLKDTPFYAKYLSEEKSKLYSIEYVLGQENLLKTIKFEYQELIPFNGIPTDVFQEVESKIQKIESENNFKKQSKDIYKKVFEVIKDRTFIVDDDSKYGIGAGFGPIFLLKGIDPNSLNENDNFRIFSKQNPVPVNLEKEFLNDPKKFVLKYPEYLDFYDTITKTERDLNKAKSPKRIAIFTDLLKDYQAKQKQFVAAVKKLQSLKAQNASLEEIKKQDQEVIKTRKPFDKDIDRINKIIDEEIQDSKTTVFSLVDLYSKILFAQSVYKIQIIKGTYQNSSTSDIKNIYWLEFFDLSDNTWKMIDVYKGYLSYSNLILFETIYKTKIYNLDEEFHKSLPAGYTIDLKFISAAHVK
ncbi:hypothetical protein [Mycoplasmopsis cricetuli]|uniref:hypothetical protein n=1 Tax=Mycoplasmopsis cricetuli TaxID=171283 RepID=UPI00046E97A5|nr:hypothetical protein [Mycoplasmopsis cricetuli]